MLVVVITQVVHYLLCLTLENMFLLCDKALCFYVFLASGIIYQSIYTVHILISTQKYSVSAYVSDRKRRPALNEEVSGPENKKVPRRHTFLQS